MNTMHTVVGRRHVWGMGESGLLLETKSYAHLTKTHQVEIGTYDRIHSGPRNRGSEF